MIITLGAWYGEVGISFKFTHLVSNFIKRQIDYHIVEKYKLNELFNGKYLHVIVTTRKSQNELYVKLGPKWRKNSIHRHHYLVFPYYKIIDAEDPLREYLKNYFESFRKIFPEFGVSAESLLTIEDICYKEILNDKIYRKLCYHDGFENFLFRILKRAVGKILQIIRKSKMSSNKI